MKKPLKDYTLSELADMLTKEWHDPKHNETKLEYIVGIDEWREISSNMDNIWHSWMTKEQCKVPNCTAKHKTD